MAEDRVVAVRRNEPIVGPGGYPVVRFSRYIEAVQKVANDVQDGLVGISTFGEITGDPHDNADLNQIFNDSDLLHYWAMSRR